MEDQIVRAIKISVELIITAAIIGVVMCFVYFANGGYTDKLQYDATIKLLQAKNQLYDYDSRMVTGSDIIEAVTANARIYNFEIITKSGDYVINTKKESTTNPKDGHPYGLRLWSEDYLTNVVLGDYIFNNFNATLTRDVNQGTIIGVKFIQEGV